MFLKKKNLSEFFKIEQKNFEFNDDFPIIFGSDNKGNILYLNQGYKLGIGEELLKKIF